MTHTLTHHPLRSPVRRGFTLLEVLIVVALMALLLSIAVFALGRSITQARETATRTTLLKVDGLLQQRLEALRTLLDTPQRKNEIQNRLAAKKNYLQNNSITGVPEKMLQLMVYKDYFRAAFPQNSTDAATLYAAGQPFNGNAPNAAESSELLYYALTQADTFGVEAVGDSDFTSAEVGDTDGDGRREFIDAWGRPLRFYRWPTRLIRPTGPGGGVRRDIVGLQMFGLPAAPTASGDLDQLTLDPDDRLGVYIATINSSVMTPAQYETQYHTPDTFHVPLIVSGGVDQATGLMEPYDNSATPGRLASPTASALADPTNSAMNDNLTNRQKQK
jgi:prepilin-type N-terminal cleavage/methylation domain-containing protein